MIKLKKKINRAVSLVVSVLMIFASIGMASYAAEEEPAFIYVENISRDGGIVNYRYVDENGNEVVLENDELGCQSVSLPSEYSSVDMGYVTKPKYQNTSGVCWAFSAMSLLESDSIIKGYKTYAQADFSEAHHTWFVGRGLAEDENDLAYGDGYAIDEPYNKGGNWRISAASLARWSGAANESEFPFYNSISSMGNYDESERYNNSGGIILESAREFTNTEDIKQWIIDHGSVTAALYYDDSYFESSSSAYCNDSSGVINHQIVVVGWDDNYSAANFGSCTPSGNGAWLCKNSWSTYWGDGGYFWVSYYDTSITLFAGFTVQKSDDYYRNYTYNGAEWYSAFQFTSARQAANIFTASGYEKLSAIAVQTFGELTEIDVVIYKNIRSSYTSPVQGTAASRFSAELDGTGYHTVYLDSPVELEPGEIFSVVVKYYNPNGTTVIPVEASTADGLSYACRAGESYINLSTTGNNWSDVTKQGAYNFYIQAMTKCNHQLQIESQEATCTENGCEKIFCTQCGKTEADRVLKATGHNYSEWSEYTYSVDDGRQISRSVCERCGDTMKRGSYTSNVVPLDSFLNSLFEKLMDAIRKIFTI